MIIPKIPEINNKVRKSTEIPGIRRRSEKSREYGIDRFPFNSEHVMDSVHREISIS